MIKVLFALIALTSPLCHSQEFSHDLKVTIRPEESFIQVEDTITPPAGNAPYNRIPFTIHKGLDPVSLTPGISLKRGTAADSSREAPVENYILKLPKGVKSFTLKYKGKISHPLKKAQEYARGISWTHGIISAKGCYLSGDSYWYPRFTTAKRGERLVNFKMEVTLPEGWDAVSQGERILHETRNGFRRTVWDSPEPQEEIYLVCGKFREYSQVSDGIQIMVFLRTPDDILAGKYIETAFRYVEMYSNLIGPYPYKKLRWWKISGKQATRFPPLPFWVQR